MPLVSTTTMQPGITRQRLITTVKLFIITKRENTKKERSTLFLLMNTVSKHINTASTLMNKPKPMTMEWEKLITALPDA